MAENAVIGQRVLAFLADMILFGALYYGAIYTLSGAGVLNISFVQAQLYLTLVPQTLYVVYFFIFELIFSYTPGKRLIGLKVVNKDSENIGLVSAILRNITRWFEVMPGFLIGLFIMWGSEDNQRLGDILAGTKVIRTSTEK